jgi:hypothetical protein
MEFPVEAKAPVRIYAGSAEGCKCMNQAIPETQRLKI